MFKAMTGRQLAGWGYGIFWMGLLVETINTIVSAMAVSPLTTPTFWIGQVMSLGCVVVGVSMVMCIRHRTW